MLEGIGQSLAMQAFANFNALAPVEGMGAIGEFRLVPDPATFVVLPYAPHSGVSSATSTRRITSPGPPAHAVSSSA